MDLGKVIPLITLPNSKSAKVIGELLVKHSFKSAEVTFRTDAAPDVIKEMSRVNGLIVGAGTVSTIDQVKQTIEVGGQYIITPGINKLVIEYCLQENIPVFPGVITPSEIIACQEYGLKTLKLFPASVFGGTKLLKALNGPFGDIQFIPTGGINTENIHDYLSLPNVISVGGTFVINEVLIEKEDWTALDKHMEAVSYIIKKNS